MKEVGGKTKTIQELLSNQKYELDYYQREYSWMTTHVTDLLQDLNNKFSESYQDGDESSDVPGYGNYFLGSIIITNTDNKSFIIDGQQRLTTLTLLLIKLYHSLDDEDRKGQITPLIFSLKFGKKSFNLDIPEREHVMGALFSGEQFDMNSSSESIVNIAARYNDIEDHFPEKLQGKALPCFVDWLIEKVCLVEITTQTDEDAYTIFETMNDRGLSLTPTEMLRGYLLSKVNNKEHRNHSLRVWDERINKLKSLGKDGESNAIKAWLRSQYARNINEFDKIGTEFHRWVREEQKTLELSSSEDFSDFIEHTYNFYCKWYERLQKASKKLTPGFEYVYYNAQNITFQYTFLLAPLNPTDTEAEIIRKIQLVGIFLDIFIHRRIWNSLPTYQNLIADQMFPIIPAIRKKNTTELSHLLYKQLDIQNQENISTLAIPPFDNNLLRLQGNNRRKIQLILARITEYLEKQSGQSSKYTEYIRKTGSNVYILEHILPENQENDTDDYLHDFEIEEYRNRIGGLLLLPKKNSNNFMNLPFSEKCVHYRNENLLAQSLHEETYRLNQGFKQFVQKSGLKFVPHSQFEKNDLDSRQKLYQEIAERIWNPERLKLDYDKEPDHIPATDNKQKALLRYEEIRKIVPPEIKNHYELKFKDYIIISFYRKIAELYNLIQSTEWSRALTPNYHRDFFAFYYRQTPIVGINLNESPRFIIWISKEEAIKFNRECEFESYNPEKKYAVYQIKVQIGAIRPIIESVSEKHINSES